VLSGYNSKSDRKIETSKPVATQYANVVTIFNSIIISFPVLGRTSYNNYLIKSFLALGRTCYSNYVGVFLPIFFFHLFYLAVMDVDDAAIVAAGPRVADAAASAADAAREALLVAERRRLLQTTAPAPVPAPVPPAAAAENKVKDSFSPGNVFKQCSNAKKAEKRIEIHSYVNDTFVTEPATVNRIGNMYREGDPEMSNTFHGARIMKGGKLVNECMSSSFDPATLHCITCSERHSILGSGSPTAICFSDQNFLPVLGGNNGTNCMGVVRLEDAKLGDLTNLVLEVFEKHALHPGSVILIGSATHLFQEGVTSYASSWLGTLSRLNARFKNINVCPLIPILRDDTHGYLARDIELLSFWLSRVYSGSIRGMGNVWSALNQWVRSTSVGSVHLEGGEVVKIPLPKDLISPAVFTAFYKFTSTCPALIPKQDCTATSVLVRALCTSLLRDFSISINPNPEVILPRDSALMGGTKDTKVKHLVCIGSSIMSQAIPYLRALGYTVTDLTRPGWLATDDNISALISAMSNVQIEGGCVIVLDLLGNCTYRFTQFDGTLALPFKESNKFHLGGGGYHLLG
jgi:hypothetical protein